MAKQYIKIRGANEHNLKNISVDIPRNELVVRDRAVRIRQIITGF